MEKQLEEQKQAKTIIKKDIAIQDEMFKKRLAERRKTRQPRANSVCHGGLNSTLPLDQIDHMKGGQDKIVEESSMNNSLDASSKDGYNGNGPNISPQKQANQSSISLLNLTQIYDDQKSQNRSTTTAGGGLATKILGNMSRILSTTMNETDEDDIGDLMCLIDELNAHTDLTVKLKSQAKILSFINEANDGKKSDAPVVKDYKKEIGRAKNDFGKLGFQSKLRLEMKSLLIDPRVKEIVETQRKKLEDLQHKKDEEVEEFMEEHAETKFKAIQKIKNKFKVQIAIATTQKDAEKIKKLEEEQAGEKKKVEESLTEKSTAGKNEIKERYNELAQGIAIDAKEFVEALLAKRTDTQIVGASPLLAKSLSTVAKTDKLDMEPGSKLTVVNQNSDENELDNILGSSNQIKLE